MSITITPMNKFDYEQIMDCLIEFAKESGCSDVCQETYDRRRPKQILLHCQLSGICLVARDGDKLVGFILSMRDQDLWIPSILRLREVAWWVKPEYRSTSVGGRLFREYVKGADQLLAGGTISSYTISRLAGSPDFDYERRGFKFLESTYMKELV